MFSNLFDKLLKLRQAHKMKILFYKDAHGFGIHGMINVSHHSYGLRHKDVAFVIAGTTVPPHLTPDVFIAIMEEAQHQGYTPHHLTFYGISMPVVIPSGTDLSDHLARLAESTPNVEIPTVLRRSGGDWLTNFPEHMLARDIDQAIERPDQMVTPKSAAGWRTAGMPSNAGYGGNQTMGNRVVSNATQPTQK